MPSPTESSWPSAAAAYGTAALIAKNSGVVNGAISSGGAPKPAASPAAKRARSGGPIPRTWPATASSARGAGWPGSARRSMSGRTSRALSPYWPPSSSAPASGSPRPWSHPGQVGPGGPGDLGEHAVQGGDRHPGHHSGHAAGARNLVHAGHLAHQQPEGVDKRAGTQVGVGGHGPALLGGNSEAL